MLAPGVVWFKFAVALVAFAAVPVAAALSADSPDPALGLMALGGLLVYVVLSTVFTPRPDYTDMGLLGGLIDDRSRLSDNLNRGLFWLLVLTGPGRFLGTAVIDVFRLVGGEAHRR